MRKGLLGMACMAALASAGPCLAQEASIFAPRQVLVPGHGVGAVDVPKAASAITLGSRAVSNNSQTVFGGFQLASAALVYILVRGNSLGTLNITQNYLDLPHLRIYNAAGVDIYTQNGFLGFNGCTTVNDPAVVSYYAGLGIAVSQFDACIGDVFPAGVYTFTVTPSIAGSTSPINSTRTGEILFEVKLGP